MAVIIKLPLKLGKTESLRSRCQKGQGIVRKGKREEDLVGEGKGSISFSLSHFSPPPLHLLFVPAVKARKQTSVNPLPNSISCLRS